MNRRVFAAALVGLTLGVSGAKATEMAVRWGYTQVHYYALGMEEGRALARPVGGP